MGGMPEEIPPAAPPPAKRGRGLWIGVAIVIVVVAIIIAAVLGGLFAAPAAEHLRIGTLLSLTGSLRDYGPGNTKGAQLAVEQINAGGGVLGQPIELFIADDQTSPTAAAGATTKLITSNHVNAIVGAQFSGGTIASISIAKANSVPMVSPSATSPSLSNLTLTGGWFFRTTPNDNLQGVVAAQYLFNNLSYRYVNIMNINDPYGNGLAGVVKSKFIALGGHVNTTVVINPALTDFTTDITTLFSTNPQAVYFIAFPDEGLTVMKEWQAGLASHPGVWNRPWVFAEGLRSPDFMVRLLDPAVGVDVTKIKGTAPITQFGAVYDVFAAQYKARFFGQTPLLYTDNAYDGVYVIALAAQKAGKLDGASIKANLRAISGGTGAVIKPGDWAIAVADLKAGTAINWEGAAGSENFNNFGDVTGPYEVWSSDSAGKIYQVAFIPESIIQPAPPVHQQSPASHTSSVAGFVAQVQTIAYSRWD